MRSAIVNCMKTLQIRNVPDPVHAELKSRAAKAGLSLSEFLLQEVERIAAKPPLSEVLERARQRPATGLTRQQIVDSIRAGRDER